MILVYSTFLVGVLYFIFSRESRAFALAAFCLGTIFGVLSCIILAFLPINNLQNSASIWSEAGRIYLNYFFIPAIVSLPLFLLVSFSFSKITFLASSSMFMGMLTIIFVYATFKFRFEPESFRAEIFLMTIFSVVFLYDLLLKIFVYANSFLSKVSGFFVASILLIVLCYPISLVLASYHFSNSVIATSLFAAILLFVAIIPQRLISIFA